MRMRENEQKKSEDKGIVNTESVKLRNHNVVTLPCDTKELHCHL